MHSTTHFFCRCKSAMFIFDIFDSVSGKICKLRSLELEKKRKIDRFDR